MREELLKIVYWKLSDNEGANGMARPAAKDRVGAAKAVVMLDLALLNAELANGLYKKPLEVLARDIRYEPLPPDVRAIVLRSWANFGMLPAATVEKMVPPA